jgi:multidrug transporter EmrE-like cation transporter
VVSRDSILIRINLKNYLLIFPIALLVTVSQLVVKWRTNSIDDARGLTTSQYLLRFLTDPVILSAYLAALIASFAWLYVVSRLPLTVAFPVYIGVTFAMVLLGGWYFLSESMNTTKFVAILLIFCGIIIGVRADK